MFDATYKHAISSSNLSRCSRTESSRARVGALVVPSGLVADRHSFRFELPNHERVVIHVLELEDVASWRAAGSRFAARVRAACAAELAPAVA